ncbi:hypothetical protein AX15_007005 [Amanita polypyramis BW_CC]|nr:hypothetical protein AX15_007005 [Amanita polypyramis BW_CC]
MMDSPSIQGAKCDKTSIPIQTDEMSISDKQLLCTDALSAVYTIPNELICEIFGYLSKVLDAYYPCKFPWYLGQICSRWRAVFHTMRAEFWGEIDIQWESPPDAESRYMHMVEVVGTFLMYNQEAPLTFTYSLDEDATYTTDQWHCIHMVLYMLVKRSPTWSDASLDLSVSHLPILCKARNHLCNLRTLSIYISLSFFLKTRKPNELTDIFKNAPSLMSVDMKDFAGWEFNWSTLTSLSMGIGDNTSALDLAITLSQMTNLEELTIYDSPAIELNDGSYSHEGNGDHDFDEPEVLRAAMLPCLKKLLLVDTKFLDALAAPALENLVVACLDPDLSVISAGHIAPFLKWSSYMLISLFIAFFQGEPVIEFIQHAPSVEHLTLIEVQDLRGLLRYLTVPHRFLI